MCVCVCVCVCSCVCMCVKYTGSLRVYGGIDIYAMTASLGWDQVF